MKKLLSLGLLSLSIISLAACSQKSNDTTSASSITEAKTEEQSSSVAGTNKENTQNNVPREYRNALKSAENYLSFTAFSKQGLYDQLTSEAGDKYPAEAAQYAVDNVKADWKEQALKSAKNYQEIMPMSDEQLKGQLTSEAGDKFTEEEAQYAIEHLEK